MAVIYATLILKGAKEFKDVLEHIKPEVRQVLTDLGYAHLAE